MLVYCIENVVTRKRYIGVTTTTISVRWNAHVYRNQIAARPRDVDGRMISTEIH